MPASTKMGKMCSVLYLISVCFLISLPTLVLTQSAANGNLRPNAASLQQQSIYSQLQGSNAAADLLGASFLRPVHRIRSLLLPFIQDSGVLGPFDAPSSVHPSLNPLHLLFTPLQLMRRSVPFFADMQDGVANMARNLPLSHLLRFNIPQFAGNGFRSAEEFPPLNLVMEDLAVAQNVATGVNYLMHDVDSLVEGLIVAKSPPDLKKAEQYYNNLQQQGGGGYYPDQNAGYQSGGLLANLQNSLFSNVRNTFDRIIGQGLAIPDLLTGGTLNLPSLLGLQTGGGFLQNLGLNGNGGFGGDGNPIAAIVETVVGTGRQLVSNLLPGLVTDSSLNLQNDFTRRSVRSAEQVEADIGALNTIFSSGKNIQLVNSVEIANETLAAVQTQPENPKSWADVAVALRQLYRDLVKLPLAYDLSQDQSASAENSKKLIAELTGLMDDIKDDLTSEFANLFSAGVQKLGAALKGLHQSYLVPKGKTGARVEPAAAAAGMGGGYPVVFGLAGRSNDGFDFKADPLLKVVAVPFKFAHAGVSGLAGVVSNIAGSAQAGVPNLLGLQNLYADRVSMLPVSTNHISSILKMLTQLRRTVDQSIQTVTGVQIEGLLGPAGGILGLGKLVGLDRAIDSTTSLLHDLEGLGGIYGFDRSAGGGASPKSEIHSSGFPGSAVIRGAAASAKALMKSLGPSTVQQFAARRLFEDTEAVKAAAAASVEEEPSSGFSVTSRSTDAFKVAGFLAEIAEMAAHDAAELIQDMKATFTCTYPAVNHEAVHLLQAAALAGDAVTVMKAVNATEDELRVALNPAEAAREGIVLRAAPARTEAAATGEASVGASETTQAAELVPIPGALGDICRAQAVALQAASDAAGQLTILLALTKTIAATPLQQASAAVDLQKTVMASLGLPATATSLASPVVDKESEDMPVPPA